jgi:membrane associated rhomboid family serine protease
MGCLVPMAGSMASSDESPFYTHFVYMFGHANFLHWIINGWAMLVLHNLFRPHRLEVCYLLAVILSFIPNISGDSDGLLGASVITTFFFGFLTPHIRRTDKTSAYMMLALILVGFLIPGIAALPHLLMYLCGIGYFCLEGLLLHFLRFCKS